jgi:probable F420-dependent oxidoreductase
VRIGVVFPQLEIGADQAAEAAGYDHLIAYDHVLGANPDRPGGFRGAYTHESLFHEPLVLYGYLAGLTQRIELWTGILILPQRQTALVAKQAAEVAVLSRGRLVMGVGVGWNEVEYEALGEDFHTRGQRMEEQVALLRDLWDHPSISFEGRFHRVTRAGINPLPPARIPLWMGGEADRVMARIGRLADGWLLQPRLREQPGGVAPYLEKIHEAATQAGREPSSIGVESRVSVAGTSVEQQLERAHEWHEAGITHLTLNTMDAGLGSPAAHIEAIQAFKGAWDREAATA